MALKWKQGWQDTEVGAKVLDGRMNLMEDMAIGAKVYVRIDKVLLLQKRYKRRINFKKNT